MLLRSFTILLMTLMIISKSFSQYSFPSKESIEKGEKIRNQFPDSKIYSALSLDNYSFSIEKKKDKTISVAVNHEDVEELIGLSDDFSYQKAVFYDSESSISFIRVQDKKGKSFTSPYYASSSDNPYSSSGIFHNDSRYKSFTLNFERLGNEKRYTIVKKINDIRYFSSIFFHNNFPIGEKKITLTVPDWLQLEIKEINFNGYTIEKKVEKNPKLKATIYTYTAKALVEYKSESHSPSISFNYPHLLVIPKSYVYNNQKNSIFSEVGDLYNWYNNLNNKVVNDEGKLKQIVQTLVKDKKEDEEKIKSIYYWVQDNIRYIAFEYGIAGFQPAPAHEVYEKKYGDCKGIANLLSHMLRLAGFDARFAWIGTRSIPYDFSTPCLSVNNHAICALFFKDKIYYLDGTESYIPLDDNAHRIQGKQVLIANGKTFDVKVVPEFPKERNLIQYNKKLTIQNGLLVGTGKEVYNGESRTMLISSYHNSPVTSRDAMVKRWVTTDQNMVVNNIKITDLSQREKPVEISYDMEVKNKVTDLNGEIYVALDSDRSFSNLIDEKRQDDYVFYSKILDRYQYEFHIPQGYKVKYLPENIQFSDESFSIEGSYKVKDNNIIYSKTITIPRGTIKKSEFAKWMVLQKQLKKFYNEQIILEKK